MRHIDSNVFIRFIANDHRQMSPASAAFFARLERNEEEAAVLESTIAEVVYVLTSQRLYALSRMSVRESLLPVLAIPGLRMESKQRCFRALDISAENGRVNFDDALVAAATESEEPHEVYSYDRGFDSLAGIRRIEP